MFWLSFSYAQACFSGERNLRIHQKIKNLAAGLVLCNLLAGAPVSAAESADVCIASPALSSCRACHTLTPGTPSSRTGPNLIGIFETPAAARKDFRYSRTLQEAREKGLVWTTESLDSYLAAPARFFDGVTGNRGSYKMLYQIRDEETRRTIINALRVLSRCEE